MTQALNKISDSGSRTIFVVKRKVMSEFWPQRQQKTKLSSGRCMFCGLVVSGIGLEYYMYSETSRKKKKIIRTKWRSSLTCRNPVVLTFSLCYQSNITTMYFKFGNVCER